MAVHFGHLARTDQEGGNADLQRAEQLRNLDTGTELLYALGAQVPFTEKLALRANLAGAFGLNDTNFEGRPLEVLAALQYRFTPGLAGHIGGGPGLTRGYGTPGFRVFAGLDWGQPGERQQRAEEPAPAPMPAPVAVAVVDTDGDGIADDRDRCPQQPEDKDGFEDQDGCPDPDNDKDGILDAQDKCPTEPGLSELRGCPAKDTDEDGVADHLDNCPTEKGDAANQGCPAQKKQLVAIQKGKLEIKEQVFFATGKAVIQPRSFKMLDQVAQVLVQHTEVDRMIIEGHTDNRGNAEANRKLSLARAEAVKTYLSSKGVQASRLEAKGFGPDRPIESNQTEKGRAANRRVEFIITTPERELPQ